MINDIPEDTIDDFLEECYERRERHRSYRDWALLSDVPERAIYWTALLAAEEDLILQVERNYVEQHTKGYVYLLKSVTGFWKIGRTVNPKDRLKTFGVKLPFEVEYEHLIPCRDHIELERSLHKQFADKRVNGEWFDLSPEDIAVIKSIHAI